MGVAVVQDYERFKKVRLRPLRPKLKLQSKSNKEGNHTNTLQYNVSSIAHVSAVKAGTAPDGNDGTNRASKGFQARVRPDSASGGEKRKLPDSAEAGEGAVEKVDAGEDLGEGVEEIIEGGRVMKVRRTGSTTATDAVEDAKSAEVETAKAEVAENATS
jgi:hypothetical protein